MLNHPLHNCEYINIFNRIPNNTLEGKDSDDATKCCVNLLQCLKSLRTCPIPHKASFSQLLAKISKLKADSGLVDKIICKAHSTLLKKMESGYHADLSQAVKDQVTRCPHFSQTGFIELSERFMAIFDLHHKDAYSRNHPSNKSKIQKIFQDISFFYLKFGNDFCLQLAMVIKNIHFSVLRDASTFIQYIGGLIETTPAHPTAILNWISVLIKDSVRVEAYEVNEILKSLSSIREHAREAIVSLCHAAAAAQEPLERRRFRLEVAAYLPFDKRSPTILKECCHLFLETESLNKIDFLRFLLPFLLTNQVMEAWHSLLSNPIRSSTSPIDELPAMRSCRPSGPSSVKSATHDLNPLNYLLEDSAIRLQMHYYLLKLLDIRSEIIPEGYFAMKVTVRDVANSLIYAIYLRQAYLRENQVLVAKSLQLNPLVENIPYAFCARAADWINWYNIDPYIIISALSKVNETFTPLFDLLDSVLTEQFLPVIHCLSNEFNDGADALEIVNLALPYLTGLKHDDETTASIISAFIAIPKDQRKNIADLSQNAIRHFKTGSARAGFLKLAMSLPQDMRRTEVMEDILASLLIALRENERCAPVGEEIIYELIAPVYVSHGSDACKYLAGMIQNMHLSDKRSILQHLQNEDNKPRSGLLSALKRFTPIFTELPQKARISPLLSLLIAFKQDKIDEALEVLTLFTPLLKDSYDTNLGCHISLKSLVSELIQLPDNLRKEWIPLFSNLFRKGKSDSFSSMSVLTKTLKDTPPGKEQVQKIFTFFLIDRSDATVLELCRVLQNLAPAHRLMAAERLPEIYIEEKNPKKIFQLFLQTDKIREDTISYYLQTLNDHIADKQEMERMVSWIIDHRLELVLDDQDPLLQKAFEVQSIVIPDNRNNPYLLFRELKQEEQQPLHPFVPPFEAKAYPFLFSTQDGSTQKEIVQKRFSINLDFLRKKREEKKGFIFSDLPAAVHPNSLNALFVKAEERFASLPEMEMKEIENYLSSQYGSTLAGLKDQVLGKPLIPSLMKIKKSPEDPIDNSVFYLFSVVRAIMDQSTELKSGELLTTQETMLLNFSWSLRECSTGQKDGIAGFYNILEVKYRKAGNTVELDYKENINALIDDSVQKVLSAAFVGESLTQAILGARPWQMAHQTLYLKNRFAKQLGYKHRLEFDPHTGVVETDLLKATTEDFLTHFFKLNPPSKFAAQLKRDINEAIHAEAKNAEASLSEALRQYVQSTPGTPWCEPISVILNRGEEGVVGRIQGNVRLSLFLSQDPVFRDMLKGRTFNEMTASNFANRLTDYFKAALSCSIQEKQDWLPNYLEIADDGVTIRGITELGALELLRAAGYLLE